MKTDLLLPVATAALLAMMLLGLSPEPVEARQQRPDASRIHFMESLPDYRVQAVDSFLGITIEYVDTIPRQRK
jgi:hypothetical protein